MEDTVELVQVQDTVDILPYLDKIIVVDMQGKLVEQSEILIYTYHFARLVILYQVEYLVD